MARNNIFLNGYKWFRCKNNKLIDNFINYPHSSYQSMINNSSTQLQREELFEYFGGRNEFIEFHNFHHEEKRIQEYIIEE